MFIVRSGLGKLVDFVFSAMHTNFKKRPTKGAICWLLIFVCLFCLTVPWGIDHGPTTNRNGAACLERFASPKFGSINFKVKKKKNDINYSGR